MKNYFIVFGIFILGAFLGRLSNNMDKDVEKEYVFSKQNEFDSISNVNKIMVEELSKDKPSYIVLKDAYEKTKNDSISYVIIDNDSIQKFITDRIKRYEFKQDSAFNR